MFAGYSKETQQGRSRTLERFRAEHGDWLGILAGVSARDLARASHESGGNSRRIARKITA
jgi:hypothetical protein